MLAITIPNTRKINPPINSALPRMFAFAPTRIVTSFSTDSTFSFPTSPCASTWTAYSPTPRSDGGIAVMLTGSFSPATISLINMGLISDSHS